ncbi:hypothetical protein BC828DRAFT_132899 [Blastocladiella britannica]|nr:hypothetical protein BC828DRAFT_132899 [Blastocladiella britannica]
MKRTCWICESGAAHGDGDNWVKPCKCHALVHQRCLLGYIASKQDGDETRPILCPHCRVKYVLRDSTAPVLVRVVEAVDACRKWLSPYSPLIIAMAYAPDYVDLSLPTSLGPFWTWIAHQLHLGVVMVAIVASFRIYSTSLLFLVLIMEGLSALEAASETAAVVAAAAVLPHVPFQEIGFWPPSSVMVLTAMPLAIFGLQHGYSKLGDMYLGPKEVARNERLLLLRAAGGADNKVSAGSEEDHAADVLQTRIELGTPDYSLDKLYALLAVFLFLLSVAIEMSAPGMFAPMQ